MSDLIAEINDCRYLFLSKIQELDNQGLRLLVVEGQPAGEVEPLQVAGTEISRLTRIDITEEGRAFEIVWDGYIAYSVLNESFAAVGDEERYEGTRFRVYSKSRFMKYVSQATFASAEYPGPAHHYGVACENHIVDVISTAIPKVQRLR